MKIQRIKINNFRTYYGEHTIDLSVSDDRPLTVLIGENGSGKTSLLNAVYWTFTGDTTQQFAESDILLNKDAAAEKNKECSVEITFFSDSKTYILKRSTTQRVSPSQVLMGEISKNGIYSSINEAQVSNIIERLIPKKLASWFIFDGEAIGSLHLNGDSRFKSDLQRTFGFNTINTLRTTLEEIIRDYSKEQRQQIGNQEIDDLGDEIDILEQKVQEYDSIIEKLSNTAENARQKISILNGELSGFSKAEPLQNKISTAERQKKELLAQLKIKIEKRDQLTILNFPQVLLSNHIERLEEILRQKEIDQSLPEPFGTRLIDDIQKLGRCICGAEIRDGNDAYKHLEAMRERAATSLHLQRISLIRAQIGVYLRDCTSYEGNKKALLTEIGILEANISAQDQLIKSAKEERASIKDEEIKKLRDKLTEQENIKSQADVELGSNRAYKEQAKVTLLKKKQELDKLIAQFARNNNVSVQKRKFEKLLDYVKEQSKRQEQEVLNALNAEITGVLEQYLTKNFTADVDPDSYAVHVSDVDGRKVALSTGETNVLKFAVIAAIVGMAGTRTKISKVNWLSEPIIAPLLFDAPFSVVDSEYRAGIANNLSSLASQLVMLFDGDKWEGQLSELLHDKVGKVYLLVSKAKGSEKSTKKMITISNKEFPLNEYGSERDETRIIEVVDAK